MSESEEILFSDSDSDPDFTTETQVSGNLSDNSTSSEEILAKRKRKNPVKILTSNGPPLETSMVGPTAQSEETKGTIKVRGRKRTRNTEEWARRVETKKRLTGKEYKTRSGKVIAEKFFSDNECGCVRKCNEKISTEQRKNIFQSFYAVPDHIKQNFFIRRSVQVSNVQRHRPTNNTKKARTQSFTYFFRIEKESVRVCKKYFRDTLQVSDGRIHAVCSKDDIHAALDGRGHRAPTNKIDTSDVERHISSFPAYTSHYTRNHNPNRKYLHPDLTIKKMYNMYVLQCQAENKQPVKEKMYYHVFSTNYNLHFKQPAKDTCQYCDVLQMKISCAQPDEKKHFEHEKELHLRKAQKARDSLKADQELAKNNDETYIFTFDLQKALPFPKLSTSVAYYKRNLYVYNFGCHAFNDNQGHMYVWPETEGSRGSQEVAACLKKHIVLNANTHKHITMYSDSCTGQNRNSKTVLSMAKLVQSACIKAEIIDLKFLVSGHSYLPNDSDFGVVENKGRKTTNIFRPDDWYDVIRQSKSKNPFVVTEMKREEFLSTKPLEDAVTIRKKTLDGTAVNWMDMRWIRLDRLKPYIIQYKTTFSEDMSFFEIDIKKKTVGRPPTLSTINQNVLYPTVRPVTKAKKQDMMSLLKYIPPLNHNYYKQLVVLCEVNNELDNDIVYTDD
ncbi:hypothetical protein C0J52_02354 [Blattella germanica]|nr:hypothetical protein C0J52_02354 [Blattella germanica]